MQRRKHSPIEGAVEVSQAIREDADQILMDLYSILLFLYISLSHLSF